MTDSVLVEAHDLVHADRGDVYGHPAEDYARTVAIFNAITGRDLTAVEGVLFMKAVKLSRLGHGIQSGFDPGRLRDHVVDDAGYDECLWSTLTYEEAECRTPST